MQGICYFCLLFFVLVDYDGTLRLYLYAHDWVVDDSQHFYYVLWKMDALVSRDCLQIDLTSIERVNDQNIHSILIKLFKCDNIYFRSNNK